MFLAAVGKINFRTGLTRLKLKSYLKQTFSKRANHGIYQTVSNKDLVFLTVCTLAVRIYNSSYDIILFPLHQPPRKYLEITRKLRGIRMFMRGNDYTIRKRNKRDEFESQSNSIHYFRDK